MNAKDGVKTADRTLDVFEAFQALKKPVGRSELAAFIKAPMSSCHDLVHTLRDRLSLFGWWPENILSDEEVVGDRDRHRSALLEMPL